MIMLMMNSFYEIVDPRKCVKRYYPIDSCSLADNSSKD